MPSAHPPPPPLWLCCLRFVLAARPARVLLPLCGRSLAPSLPASLPASLPLFPTKVECMAAMAPGCDCTASFLPADALAEPADDAAWPASSRALIFGVPCCELPFDDDDLCAPGT